MDGGPGQRQKAEEVKREVKNAAARRRGTELVDALETPMTAMSVDREDGLDEREQPRHGAPTACPYFGTPDSSPSYVPSASGTIATQHLNANGSRRLDHSVDSELSLESEGDRRFIIFYLDHFFPFLFPFYRPSLLEGGRGWVMELIIRNKAMRHTTLCLSTYFVSVALDGVASGHEFCKLLAWEELLDQTSAAFDILRRDIQEVKPNTTVVDTSRVMGGIIQLQRFETSVGNFENFQTHLDAAMALFKQILWTAGNNDGEATFEDILGHMGDAPWILALQQRSAWSSDQAAFRFFTALLVFDDIIASTCLEEPPRLLSYHAQLLTDDCIDGTPMLKLEEFVGCENWVMIQIGAIAALDAWKKSLRKAGQLDMMELVGRASFIKQMLLGNLERLDAAPRSTNPIGLFSLYNDLLPPISGGSTALVTRIWAHAALLYLSVVVSGWQPGNASIRENVTLTLGLLEKMPEPALLRTVVWPFCVVGCLAEAAEECRLRAMVEALVPLRLFGPARKAMDIMENVWKNRNAVDIETWDFAACVRSLGHVALLV